MTVKSESWADTQAVKNEYRITAHEEKCDLRYEGIIRRLERLEKIIWTFICGSFSAFGLVLYHLIIKLPS